MLLSFALVLLLALILALPLYADSYQNIQFGEPSYALTDGWVLEDGQGNFQPVQMPYILPDGDTTYVFHYAFAQLPPQMFAPVLMLDIINTAYQLYVDGIEVSRYPQMPYEISLSQPGRRCSLPSCLPFTMETSLRWSLSLCLATKSPIGLPHPFWETRRAWCSKR